jgi:hypothetical protein
MFSHRSRDDRIFIATTVIAAATTTDSGSSSPPTWSPPTPPPPLVLTAAIGVSMMIGGLNMSAGVSLASFASSNWAKLKETVPLLQVLACLGFGLSCKLVKSQSTRPWAFPCFVLSVVILFYIVLFASGFTLLEARSCGWLFAVSAPSKDSARVVINFNNTDAATASVELNVLVLITI